MALITGATLTSVCPFPQTTWLKSWSSWVKSHRMWLFAADTLLSTSTAEVCRIGTSNPRAILASHMLTCMQVTCGASAPSDCGACTTSWWRSITSSWRRPPPSRTSCSGCWITDRRGGPQRLRAFATRGCILDVLSSSNSSSVADFSKLYSTAIDGLDLDLKKKKNTSLILFLWCSFVAIMF